VKGIAVEQGTHLSKIRELRNLSKFNGLSNCKLYDIFHKILADVVWHRNCLNPDKKRINIPRTVQFLAFPIRGDPMQLMQSMNGKKYVTSSNPKARVTAGQSD